MVVEHVDFLVIGSGPSGQKAAVAAAKEGRSVLIVERERAVGGACVHQGTIPSKTLRETAMALLAFRQRSGGVVDVQLPPDTRLQSLMTRLDQVIAGHERVHAEQLRRNGVKLVHGRARFCDAHVLEIESPRGDKRRVHGARIVIATGSRPRTPPEIPVDHEHILDSDSVLSMAYLPSSLTVLGAGIIASEYASIFSALGVRVTMIDRGERPVSMLDAELTGRFVESLARRQGRFIGKAQVSKVIWDGLGQVETTLADGEVVRGDKALVCLGRVANLHGLCVEAAGLTPNARGVLDVDAHCRTAVAHIYAVGDVIGPPSLASAAMEQGRRAVSHALGLAAPSGIDLVPIGVYTIPEMSSVGLCEAEAHAAGREVVVGRAAYAELARGQIAAIEDGLLKLVADARDGRLLGAQIVGEGAAELIHVAQMALVAGLTVEVFIDQIFNFPTLAEAYRVAALDAKRRLAQR